MTVRQTLTTTITTTSAATQTQSAYTFASLQTTAGSLGLSGEYTIWRNTSAETINIGYSDTIETMLTKLNNNTDGVIFSYEESTGKFNVYGNYENGLYWGLNAASATRLRITTTYAGQSGIYAGTSSFGFYTTRTVTTVVNTTSTISTTSTVSVAVTKTITDTFTVALDTTGKATINIQQTLTVSATRTEKVDTTGSTVINVKQTLTIQATSTERVNTTGTVRVTQTVTVTAHQTITVDVTSTNTYTANKSSADYNAFSTVNNMDGNTKLADVGLAYGIINGVSNGEAFSVTINSVETIDGISSRLAAYGIEVSIKNGSMTFKGSKNSYITSASGAAASLGAGSAYTTQTENHNYNTNSNNQGYSTIKNITTDSIFSDMGLTSNGTITIKQDGTIYTVTVKTGDTVDDFLTQLAAYDIKGSVSDGKITLTGTDNSFVMSASNNLTNIIKLKTGEGNSYNSSTYTVKTTLDTKLNQLTDTSGNSLGITNGNIYVYQDGTRYLVNINNEDTLQTLASKLSQYGIAMGLDSNGKLYFDGTNNSYMTTQGITSGASNLLTKLNIADNWNIRYDSVSENLCYNVDTNNCIEGNTKLSDLQDKDGNNLNITEGAFYVYNNGVRTTETITSDMTIDDLKALFAKNGLIVDIDQNGSISVGAYNNTYLATSATSGANSNIVSTLFAEWDFVNIYTSNGITIPKDVIKAVTRDTKLADINEGTYVDGCITVVHDGIQTNISLTADDTIGTLIDELALYGFNSVINNSGQLIIKSDGDSTLKEYTGADKASNLLDLLGINSANWVLTNSYSNNDTKTYEVITSHINATDDTLLSELDIIWGDDVLKAQGQLAVTVDGVTHKINITDNETFGSLKEKFAVLGLEATISDGVFMIQSGYKDMNFDMANTTSSIVTNLGLVFHDDLGGYSATDSMSSVEQTTTVVTSHTDSVANYAGYDTKMGLLNISDGTLSIYKNGEKATIQIKKDETFGDLRSRISSAFSDVDLTFEDGYLKIFSKNPDDSIEVGATTDTSNFAAITGISSDGKTVSSARELYCVNSDSVIMNSGLFRRGDVTEGTFIVGDATFSISNTTTLAGLISQINSNDAANATAYWDSIDGKLVIKSRTTGSALINIEAGTSNFTDIMGYTNTTWAADGSVETTKMNVNVQDVGNNAKFSINGTYYTSNSNTITSDISRIKGLTINLKGLTEDSAVTLTVERDKETLANAVSDIVDSYNELMKNVDEAISKDGKLHDQSVLKLVRNQLRNMMTSSDAGTTVFRNLDAIGIKVENASANNISTDNITTLTFDKDKFIQAYEADEDALKALLIGSDSNTGIFTKVETLIESSLKAVTGYFATAEASYDREVKDIENKIDKQKKALDRYRAQLEAKFASMDILIANMQQQYSSFLTT